MTKNRESIVGARTNSPVSNATQNVSRRKLMAAFGGAIVANQATSSLAREIRKDVSIERRYVDCRYGQLHLHIAAPLDRNRATRNPLICFHPSPASGWYFRDFIADMGRDRIAIAADTPGFGESDRPPSRPDTMSEYSGAMADALEAMNYGNETKRGKIDLLGYLTGCVIALDLAVTRPDLVRRVCLVAPPYIDDDALRKKRIRQLTYGPYTEEGKRIFKTWDYAVKRRVEGVTLEQSIKLFQERLRAGDKDWWAYKAVYNYPYAEKYKAIKQPIAIMNPHGSSFEGTTRAAKNTPTATLVDLPELSNSVFSLGSDIIAAEARKFLD